MKRQKLIELKRLGNQPIIEVLIDNKSSFNDEFAGNSFTVHWDEEVRNAYITNANEKLMVTTVAFWFAWAVFHPETRIWEG